MLVELDLLREVVWAAVEVAKEVELVGAGLVDAWQRVPIARAVGRWSVAYTERWINACQSVGFIPIVVLPASRRRLYSRRFFDWPRSLGLAPL